LIHIVPAHGALTALHVWIRLIRMDVLVECAANSTLRGIGLDVDYGLAVSWCVDHTVRTLKFDKNGRDR